MTDDNLDDKDALRPEHEAPDVVPEVDVPPAVEEEPSMEEPAVEPVAPEAEAEEEEPRGMPFWQRALRWVLAVLVVFGLGVVLTLYTTYVPTSRDLQRARAELAERDQEIDTLEARVEELSALEEDNEALEEAVDRAELHVQILSALTDVRSAQLALALEDRSRARVHLTNTPDTLTALGELLEPDRADLVESLQERLELVMEELEDDTFAAQSDLEVLANNLVELENAIFTTP